jgi:hypothetical protein
VFGLVIFVIIPIYFNYLGIDHHIDPKNTSKEVKVQIQGELDKIQPMPGAEFLGNNMIFRNGSGYISYKYSTDANYLRVLDYYDSILKKQGWEYDKKESLRPLFIGTGGKRIVYQKGTLKASVSYGEDDLGKTVIGFSISR